MNSVAFSPDGRVLATASADGTVRFWSLDTYETVATLIPLPEKGYAVLFPNGSYKLNGDPGDAFWWAMKLCRFEAGELDPYVPGIKRLSADEPMPWVRGESG